uniref:ankyrin repeat-containing protein At3g12360-like isoform X1 n=1 Tax=Fragaria vesca subsp. vesca TaxID=101020 RepID=UPI0005C96728|nr:PREDICTED: ankyrin repeat-containing protein At3g12360-like isoform X1 [Fragaria vesca subsp. vesca]
MKMLTKKMLIEKNSIHDNSKRSATVFPTRVISSVNRSVWSVLRAWSTMRDIYDERKKHGLALELARILIAADYSWVTRKSKNGVNESAAGETRKPSQTETPDIPLFIATSNGILEIVEETLTVHPLLLEYTNKEKQNILHLAVMHRQSHILDRVTKRNKKLTSRLARQTDKHGFTILHYVGNMKFYKGGTQHGPALQLQEELQWYEEVKKLVPPYYAMNRSRINEQTETLQEFLRRKYDQTVRELSKNVGKIIPPKSVSKLGWDESKEETPIEYFGRTHGELLEEAQNWLERTSDSCSLVAALIASVAFAAAFTIPGGNSGRNGQPILIDSPFFVVFIITDALSIASSLMSLAMFLSILSSPYELDDFRHSLPRKLTLGFTSLFFSVAVTSLAFTSTLMLTTPIKKRLTTTFIYCVAVLPVTMFALLQYPLYLAFKKSLKTTFKVVKRVLPWPLTEAACSKCHTS